MRNPLLRTISRDLLQVTFDRFVADFNLSPVPTPHRVYAKPVSCLDPAPAPGLALALLYPLASKVTT